ncbi:MAG TPA: hypothetical protein VFI11_03160 [Anaerolineales bacterium]|nr:hypothetical protein [Anaerolineales bacterium]
MPSSSVRRFLTLLAPLVLVLAACQGGSEQTLGELPTPVAVSNGCAAADLQVRACSGEDAGAECAILAEVRSGNTPEEIFFVPWPTFGGQAVDAPEVTWTYPCNPDGYYLSLMDAPHSEPPSYLVPGTAITAYDPDLGGPVRSWMPDVQLTKPANRYVYNIVPFLTGDTGTSAGGRKEFWTGPLCTEPDISGQIWLWEPQDGEVLTTPSGDHAEPIPFSWIYPVDPVIHPCLEQFEARVSPDESFQTGVIPISTSAPMARNGTLAWEDLEPCRTYYWQVRVGTTAGFKPFWSEPFTFRILPEGGEEQCPQVDVGPSLGAPEAIVDKNAACRFGPSTLYGIASYVSAGERHPVEGRNAAGTWLKLKDLGCYVLGELLHLERDGTPVPDSDSDDLTLALAVLPDPPLPTESSLVCTSTLGPGECADAGGTYEYLTSPTGGPAGQRCNCP